MQTAPVLAPPAPPAAPVGLRTPHPFIHVTLPALLVLVAALAVATVDYGRFLQEHRHLWTGAIHDRHAHYLTALSLATDVRHGDLVLFVRDFDRARVWPPLHALLAGAVLAVGGPDHRLAVLPSLLAFVGTVLLGFLVARRAAPRAGNVAGLTTALLILTSAPHRAFATDVMIESLGACLSLLVLYLYLVTVQSTSRRAGRCLALALTALFLTKYNYWVLAGGALVAAELTTRPRIYRRLLHEAVSGFDARRWLTAELTQPLNYLLATILILLSVLVMTGGTTLSVAGQSLSLHSPHNLILASYAVVLVRLMLAWRRHREAIWARLDLRARPLLGWHLLPVALWFLLPARLSCFLWYFSPAQTGEAPRYALDHSTEFYSTCFTQDYGHGPVVALLVLGLIALTALTGRLRPGGRVLVWFVLISAALCLLHPNRKSRFLHTWIGGAWAAAGVGLTCLTHGPLTRRRPSSRRWLAAAALGGLGVVTLPGLAVAGRAPEGGAHPERPSSLELTDSYLPLLADSRQPMVLSNVPMKFLSQWTFLEFHGRRTETEIRDFAPDNPDAFHRWLSTTTCDTVVFVEVPRTSCFYEYVATCDRYEPLRELLERQTLFQPSQSWRLPQSGCVVTVWKRPPHRCVYPMTVSSRLPSPSGRGEKEGTGSPGP